MAEIFQGTMGQDTLGGVVVASAEYGKNHVLYAKHGGSAMNTEHGLKIKEMTNENLSFDDTGTRDDKGIIFFFGVQIHRN